jgi:hypothetical protein
MSEQFSRRTAVKAASILPLAMLRGTAANRQLRSASSEQVPEELMLLAW